MEIVDFLTSKEYAIAVVSFVIGAFIMNRILKYVLERWF